MRRRDIVRKLLAAGLALKEGGRHTIVLRDGRKVSVISRSREIPDEVAREIAKQTGVDLKRGSRFRSVSMLLYPAVLFPPDEKGVSGCIVPDMLVNAAGHSPDDAVRDAIAIIEELMTGMVADGEPFPDPTPIEEFDDRGGRVVILHVPLPPRRSIAA